MTSLLNRRQFLKLAAASGSMSMLGYSFRPSPAFALPPAGDFRVLVKIELLGGMDSFGMWVPTNTSAFNALLARRQVTRFTPSIGDAVSIGAGQPLALHPGLQPLVPHISDTRLFLNVSNALTYGQTGSHEDAQNIMTMGTRNFAGRFIGWTARLYENEPSCKLLGFLNSKGANTNCDPTNARCASSPPPTVYTFENFRFDGSSFGGALGGGSNSAYVANVLQRLANARVVGQQRSESEEKFASAMRSTFPAIADTQTTLTYQSPRHGEYSGSLLSLQLRNVAMLIKRMIATAASDRCIITLGLGGFDVHDSWVTTTHNLMSDLGNSLGVFYNDCKSMNVQDKVLVMTSTEFGRMIPENGAGTDHGTSSTMLVMGGRVKGGGSAVFGDVLSANQIQTLNYPPSVIDSRGIVSTILSDFLGVNYLSAFPGAIASEFSIGNYDLWDGVSQA